MRPGPQPKVNQVAIHKAVLQEWEHGLTYREIARKLKLGSHTSVARHIYGHCACPKEVKSHGK